MARAPNRLLQLDELHSAPFQEIIGELEQLARKDAISYIHPSKRWEYPWALERAQLRPGEAVLDAGCGASIFPVYLASKGFPTTAVDVNTPRRLAKLHGVSIRYSEADLAELPYRDESFDTIFCISVIEHLPAERIAGALAEMRRILRPGGRLLLTTDFYRDSSANLWYQGPGECFPVDWNFFDRDTLERRLLRAPGLRLAGRLDTRADWEAVSAAMIEYHGYPYTSVGLSFVRE